jgi:hypothetical protein
MLLAEFLEDLFHGPGEARLEFRVSVPDAFDCFPIILPFPFECVGQDIIERGGGFLSVPLGVVVQLRFPFRTEGNHVHAPNV